MSDTTEVEFISEDDLQTFAGWLKYQAVDPTTTAPEELEDWRRAFEEARLRTAARPKVGRMKLQPVSGEHLYALAIEEPPDLWLTLWIRRNRKGEFFVMQPRGERDWLPHTSYHVDGNLHMKSYGRKVFSPLKRQPLTGTFQGSEGSGRSTARSRWTSLSPATNRWRFPGKSSPNKSFVTSFHGL